MTSPLDAGLPSAFSVLARLVLVIGTTLALHVSMMRPNPPPSETNRRTVWGLEEVTKNLLRPLVTWFSLAPGVIELAAILIRLGAPPTYDIVSGTCAERISFSILALVACLLGLCGMGIRLWCYQALGEFFTFEIALLPKHELITTGPYAFVRHPSYTGGLLTLVGATLANISGGSWAYECGVVFSWWGVVWGMIVGVAAIIIVERCTREDKLLRAEFREEWDTWGARVRWRMIPGIY